MVRYEGAGGWIEVEAEALTVCRTDLKPYPLPPRVLPLQALSGAELKDASRLRRGRLQLGFGRRLLVPAGSDEDPDTIGFTHAQQEVFRNLHGYLWNVVRTNEARGVDMAAAYEAANDPLLGRLAERDRALAEPAENRARSEHAAEQQRVSRFAHGIGPEATAHEDILAAGLASATGERSWPVLKGLPGLLLGGERVFVVAECYLGSNSGTLVLTDQRLLFIRPKFTANEIAVMQLGEIGAVAAHQKLIKGVLQVQTREGVLVQFDGVHSEDLARLDEALRLALGSLGETASGAAPTGGSAPSADVLQQLARLGELHAAGVLTTAEFEQKKQQLLDRL